MMKDDSPTPEARDDGIDASTPSEADWQFEQVEKVARVLYAHAPFAVKDMDRWKALVRQAFDFLDNLHAACEEVLGKRMERREMVAEASARAFAAQHLPLTVPFQEAVRFITGEKLNRKRALERFQKVLRYDARRIPHAWPRRYYANRISRAWPATALPKLPAAKERQLEAQLKMWEQNGIRRYEVVRLRWLFEGERPLVKAEQNRANARKRPKRTDKRRGGKRPKAERRLQPALIELAEWGKKKRTAKKTGNPV